MARSPQHVAIFLPLAISLGTTFATVVIHGFALIVNVNLIRQERKLGRAGVKFWKDVAIIARATLVALLAHLVEITIWAVVFILCGEFSELGPAIYHSAMIYTALGSDVTISPSWKLMGPLETADGMLMFGVSTAMIFAVIQRLVQTRFRDLYD